MALSNEDIILILISSVTALIVFIIILYFGYRAFKYAKAKFDMRKVADEAEKTKVEIKDEIEKEKIKLDIIQGVQMMSRGSKGFMKDTNVAVIVDKDKEKEKEKEKKEKKEEKEEEPKEEEPKEEGDGGAKAKGAEAKAVIIQPVDYVEAYQSDIDRDYDIYYDAEAEQGSNGTVIISQDSVKPTSSSRPNPIVFTPISESTSTEPPKYNPISRTFYGAYNPISKTLYGEYNPISRTIFGEYGEQDEDGMIMSPDEDEGRIGL